MKSSQSQGRVKAVTEVIARFLNTKGAKIGEENQQLTNFAVAKTNDLTGQPISLVVGQKKFFIASDWQREKVIEIKQDLPYPMTLLSLTSNLEMEGI
jgi:hypothetical protein